MTAPVTAPAAAPITASRLLCVTFRGARYTAPDERWTVRVATGRAVRYTGPGWDTAPGAGW